MYKYTKVVALQQMNSKKRQNIILVGFMGCGKTTLGKQIAKELSMIFVDMDDEIEKSEGKSISDIFSERGELYFRQLESDLLKSFNKQSNLVISTGGGAPCFDNNMDVINALGLSLYIKLPPIVLKDRLKLEKSSRPLIKGMSDDELLVFIQEKLQTRDEFYLKASQIYTTLSQLKNDLSSSIY